MLGPDTDWAREIRAFRLSRAAKQRWLADHVGVDTATVSRWERGIDRPSLAAQRKLASLMAPAPTIAMMGLPAIIAELSDIAVLMDREFRIVAASPGHRKLLRYDLSDIAGRKFPMWTDAMFQTMEPIGGPAGWWSNGIKRIDFNIMRRPHERAANPEPIYQRVTTMTVQDGLGEKYRFALTRTIAAAEYITSPAEVSTF